MKIEDVMARAIPMTGLYPTIADLELDMDAVAPIISLALSYYGKYHPIEEDRYIIIPDASHYTFGLINDRVPKWISEATFILGSSSSLTALGITQHRRPDELEPMHMPWRYQKPTLYVSSPGEYNVKCCHDRIFDRDTEEVDVTDADELFFNLLAARIMIAVGRTRRSIVFNNAEFAMDYADMVSDGTQKEETVKQEILDNVNFGLAWG